MVVVTACCAGLCHALAVHLHTVQFALAVGVGCDVSQRRDARRARVQLHFMVSRNRTGLILGTSSGFYEGSRERF